MLLVNIHEVKTHLSEYLQKLDVEKEIVLCRSSVPVAVIRPVSGPTGKRVVGREKGRLLVPDTINDPLPEAITALFNGEAR